MNVSIIPFKRVESIKDEWEELSKNQTIFQSYEWNANYLKIKWIFFPCKLSIEI